eukprot:1179817-Prorocentrum_minimum.AAC.3
MTTGLQSPLPSSQLFAAPPPPFVSKKVSTLEAVGVSTLEAEGVNRTSGAGGACYLARSRAPSPRDPLARCCALRGCRTNRSHVSWIVGSLGTPFSQVTCDTKRRSVVVSVSVDGPNGKEWVNATCAPGQANKAISIKGFNGQLMCPDADLECGSAGQTLKSQTLKRNIRGCPAAAM